MLAIQHRRAVNKYKILQSSTRPGSLTLMGKLLCHFRAEGRLILLYIAYVETAPKFSGAFTTSSRLHIDIGSQLGRDTSERLRNCVQSLIRIAQQSVARSSEMTSIRITCYQNHAYSVPTARFNCRRKIDCTFGQASDRMLTHSLR